MPDSGKNLLHVLGSGEKTGKAVRAQAIALIIGGG